MSNVDESTFSEKQVSSQFWLSDIAKHQGQIIDHHSQQKITYLELDNKINDFGKTLPKTRQLIALIASNSLEFVIAYLALLRFKHVILMVEKSNNGLTLSSRTEELLTEYSVNYITDGHNTEEKSKYTHTLNNHLAILLSTSGSTGSSKLVKLSYENLAANTQSICEFLPISKSDTVVTTLPLHYSFGLSVLQTHLAVGASIILTNATLLEKSLWQAFKAYRPTSFYGVPFSFELLTQLNLKRLPLETIQYFAQAGGKISEKIAHTINSWCEAHQKQFYIMYGQTEATARIAYLSPQKASTKSSSIGKAIPNGELQLRDVQQTIIHEENTAGELFYQGKNVFIGYANNIHELSTHEQPTWLATGDIAVRDIEGDYKIIGRNKRIVKIVGKRINLDDVEHFLQKKCLQSIAAITANDLLYLIIESEKHHSFEDIKHLLADFISINHRYILVKAVKEIARLANGKVDYQTIHNQLSGTPNE